MRKHLEFLLFLSLFCLINSCTQGTVSSDTQDQYPVVDEPQQHEDAAASINTVYGIEGPGWLYSGTPGHFRYRADSPGGIEYTFSCIPADAGVFESGTGIFTPGDIDETTDIKIVLDFTVDGRRGSHEMDVKVFPKLDGWIRKWGKTRIKDIFGPAMDGNGNLYVTGIFDQTCDFDPSVLSEDERESVLFTDCFVSKFTPDGEMVWTTTWGGYATDTVIGLVCDHSGNIYVAGQVVDVIFFGPLEDNTGFGVDGNSGGYLAKFSSEGAFQWVKMWGSANGFVDVTTIGIDNSGNPYVAGSFAGDADFSPGDEIVGGVSNGLGDAFVSKFSSNGSHMWTTSWGGNNPDFDVCQPNTLVFDGANNVYAVGIFQGEMEFGPSRGFGGRENIHQSNGVSDIFLIKLKNDGFTDWEKVWGGEFADYGIGLMASSRGLYVTGSFSGLVDFDPSRDVREYESESNHNEYYYPSTFLARYSYDGSLGWVSHWGDGSGFALDEDSNGNVLVAGFSNCELVIFEHDERIEIPGSAFVAKFNSVGEYIWGRAWGRGSEESASGVAVGPDGNIFLAGIFSGDVYWDPDDGFTKVGMVENPSAFLIKFLPDGTW